MADEIVLAAARDAYANGLCVVPPAQDGSKRPLGEWKAYQTERPTRERMREWYSEDGTRTGLGLVCGAVSRNLEAFEFDDAPTYEAFLELAHQAELGGLVECLQRGYSERTPSGGVHWLYFCDEIAGNLKLATRPASGGLVDTLIETRGEGGYMIVAPSHGAVHPSGRPYVLEAGGFSSIPTLLPEERRELHQLARAFHVGEPPAETRRQATEQHRGGRPGDDYNARASWGETLEPHGWRAIFTRADVTYWRRPGKAVGVSATTNYGGSDLLINFSTSVPLETGRGYSKFSVYALLGHGGDFSAAALALAQLGYGEPPGGASGPSDAEPPAAGDEWALKAPLLLARLAARPVVPPLVVDFLPGDGNTLLHSQPREWKTLIALHVQLAVTTATPLFGLPRLAVPIARRALYVTEEDGAARTAERLSRMAAGLGRALPDDLFVAAGSGVSLDDPAWQSRLIAFVKAESIALVTFDPLRSLSACVDQGPKELRPLALYFRRLLGETGCAILAVHHDSKPQPGVADLRRLPQRASGGAVFSIADQPIAVDALSDGRRLVRPTAWKFAPDPPPVVLTLEAGDGYLRLVGAEADGATVTSNVDVAEHVLAYLAEHPRTSGRAVADALKRRRETVAAVLKELALKGQVDSVRKGSADLWFLCGPLSGSQPEP